MAQLFKSTTPGPQSGIIELNLLDEGAENAVITNSENKPTRLAVFAGTDQTLTTTEITGTLDLTWDGGELKVPGNIGVTGLVDGRDIFDDGAELDTAVAKLSGIDAGAQVNVQSDWTAGAQDSGFILNKPLVVTDTNLSNQSEITNNNLVSVAAIKAYVDGRVTSSLNYKGGYDPDATPEALENTPSGTLTGDTYTIIADGIFNGVTVSIGDVIIAEVDGAGPDIDDWTIVSKQLDLATESAPGIVTLASSGSTAPNLVVTGDDARLALAATAVQDGDTLTTGLEFPATGLKIQDAGSPAHTLTVSHEGSADSTLTIDTGDTDRTLTFTGDATIGGTTSGINTGDVTLEDNNTPDVTFLSLTDQVLTVDKVSLSSDVTDSLAISNLATSGTASVTTFLRGDGAWASVPTTTVADDSIWAAKGDLVVGTANNSASILNIGTLGQVLKVYEESVGGPLNIRWETPVEGHSAVTLASNPVSTHDYLTISDQEITLNAIDLSTDGTKGTTGLAISNLANYPTDGTKFLSGDGTWKTVPLIGQLDDLTDVNLSVTVATDDGWGNTDPESFVEFGTHGGQTSYSSTAQVGGNTLYLWWDDPAGEWVITEVSPGGDTTSATYLAAGSITANDPLGEYIYASGTGFSGLLAGAELVGIDLSATNEQILRYNSGAGEWRANDLIVDLTTEVTGPATFVNATDGVNKITITDAATTAGPDISASGTDSNVELNISSKGAANVNINAQGVVQSNGDFDIAGDAQTATYILRTQTSGTSQEEMYFDGTSGGISVATNSTVMYRAMIVGRKISAEGDVSGAYELQGAVNNKGAGTTEILGTQIRTVFAEDESAWDVTIVADTVDDRLTFKVTGAPIGANVNWVARVDTVSCIA